MFFFDVIITIFFFFAVLKIWIDYLFSPVSVICITIHLVLDIENNFRNIFLDEFFLSHIQICCRLIKFQHILNFNQISCARHAANFLKLSNLFKIGLKSSACHEISGFHRHTWHCYEIFLPNFRYIFLHPFIEMHLKLVNQIIFELIHRLLNLIVHLFPKLIRVIM